MSGKKNSIQNGDTLDFDLEVFNRRIDMEIDRLFPVPSSTIEWGERILSADSSVEEGRSTGVPQSSGPENPQPDVFPIEGMKERFSLEKGDEERDGNEMDLDLDAFEEQVNFEIDRIFSIAVKPLTDVEEFPEIAPAKEVLREDVQDDPPHLACPDTGDPATRIGDAECYGVIELERQDANLPPKQEEGGVIARGASADEIQRGTDIGFPVPDSSEMIYTEESSQELPDNEDTFSEETSGKIELSCPYEPVVPGMPKRNDFDASSAKIVDELQFEAHEADDQILSVPARPEDPEPYTDPVDARSAEWPTSVFQSIESDGTSKLIESLSAALLTLDWDFTAENVADLSDAIMNLESCWREIHEASSIAEVLRAVLQPLKTQPDQVSSPLLNFVSDATEFLLHLLRLQTAPGLRERDRLSHLIDRLQSLKIKCVEKAVDDEMSAAVEKPIETAAAGENALSLPAFDKGDDLIPSSSHISQEMPSECETGGTEGESTDPFKSNDPQAVISEPIKSDESAWLFESLDVAIVSLEWDFSTESVETLERAITAIESHHQKSCKGSTVATMVKAVLRQLKARPDMVTHSLFGVIFDILEYFKLQVTTRGDIAPEDRERIKSLLHQLRKVRSADISNSKVEDAAPDASIPSTEEGHGGSIFLPVSSETIGYLSGNQVKEFRSWLKSLQTRLEDAAQRLEDEVNRLLRLEEVLGRKPNLAPLVARLGAIRLAMTDHMAVCREGEPEWGHRMDQLLDWEKHLSALPSSGFTAEHDFTLQRTIPTSTDTTESLDLESEFPLSSSSEKVEEALQVWKEPVCLFDLAGERIAVPASNVLKFKPLSRKQVAKIAGRSYVTLSDIKPLFRDLKSGIWGTWNNLPVKELKAYRFLALPHALLAPARVPSNDLAHTDSGDLPAPTPVVGGVILVSNAQAHGMIFTESASVDLRNETIETVGGDETTLGVIRTGSQTAIRVLNPAFFLTMLDQEGASNKSL